LKSFVYISVTPHSTKFHDNEHRTYQATNPKKAIIPIMEIIMEGALPGGASCSNMEWEILHKIFGVGL
jgi:hypothetical protein